MNDTWIAIELHHENRFEAAETLGTVPSIDKIGEWFAGASKLGELPHPKWTDELRLTEQPSGETLHVYRLGWVEVEQKPRIEIVQ